MINMRDYFRLKAELVDKWLDRLIPGLDDSPVMIHEAMRYSLFAGGKRLRPILAIASGEIFGLAEAQLLPVACSLEMIHTYSLIHDDLPSMDDDDLRRGMPTCHVKYGEALAILAGDALLTQAFITLADHGSPDSTVRLRILSEVAHASATKGALIGGQVLDLQFEGEPVTGPQLEDIHRAKTGALIRSAVRVGAILGGASEDDLCALTVYGEKIGLAFQIADDLLDVTSTTEELGKTVGKDAAAQKATYTSLYGISEARAMAARVCQEAIDSIEGISGNSAILAAIARFIVERRS